MAGIAAAARGAQLKWTEPLLLFAEHLTLLIGFWGPVLWLLAFL